MLITITGISRILNSNGRKPYIVVARARLLPQMRTLSSELDYFIDDANADPKVMFSAKGENMTHLDVMQINLQRYEKQKYENIYYRLQDCDPDRFSQGVLTETGLYHPSADSPMVDARKCLLAAIVMDTGRFVCPAFGQSNGDGANSDSSGSFQEERLWSDLMGLYALYPAISSHAKEVIQQRWNELKELIGEDSLTLHCGRHNSTLFQVMKL